MHPWNIDPSTLVLKPEGWWQTLIVPGYGFLSENAKFSEIVNKHGIKFIGPSADIISKMGDKIEAKRIAKKFGLPVIENLRQDSQHLFCIQ